MIAVSLNGRLGNQLFQYGFALSVSKRYNTFYIINDTGVENKVKEYFEPISLADNKYIRKILFTYYKRKNLPEVTQTGFEPVEDINGLIQDNKYYNGFFQSIHFFSDAAGLLKEKFKIKATYKSLFSEKYGYLFQQKKVLAIHYRLGDYLTWGGEELGGVNLSLPESYYHNALSLISNVEQYNIVVITDDVQHIQKKLSFIKSKIIISDKEINDFQMLMNADKLIISNSTFAWWAALLNINNADVYAPEFWLGFKIKKEFPVSIIPPQFIKVSFT